MEAQMHRPHGHGHHEERPQNAGLHSVIEGEGDQGEYPHGTKSVLKKVKAKAKKIKDSIKHGLGHEHEHELEHRHDNGSDQEQEDDQDEEMVEDPEADGAPIYDSYIIKSTTIPQEDVLGVKSDVNLENTTTKGEDRHDSRAADRGNVRRFMEGQEYSGETEGSLSKPTAMEAYHMPEHTRAQPASTTHYDKTSDRGDVQGQEGNVGEPVVRLGAPSGLEEDPHGPKDRPEAMKPSNYESKVTDPTDQRGEEAGIPPIVHSFGKLSVEEEKEAGPKVESEEKSYTGSHHQFSPQPTPTEGEFSPWPVPASEGSEYPETTPKHIDPSNPEEMLRGPIDGKSSGQGAYTDKVSTAASAIADKATSVKNEVASKLGYGGTEGSESHEMRGGEHDDVKPSEQSSYTDKISSATSAIADKATAAKNVVVSKLGYGRTEGKSHQGTEASASSGRSASPTEYVHKAAAAVTETLAPVYEKVAGVGSTVMSKVQGAGTGQEGVIGTDQVSHEAKARGTDKGVSMKEYLAEKLRPGEGDKALSEVISDTLHRQKERTGEAKPIGKVTESEEVAKRLGTGKENYREGEDAVIAGTESSGNSVVDKLKDAVTSWLGKGDESQTSQGSPGTPFVNTESSATG